MVTSDRESVNDSMLGLSLTCLSSFPTFLRQVLMTDRMMTWRFALGLSVSVMMQWVKASPQDSANARHCAFSKFGLGSFILGSKHQMGSQKLKQNLLMSGVFPVEIAIGVL